MSEARKLYAGKILDLGNYCLTGLLLGHVLLRTTHTSTVLLIGVGGFLIAHGFALFIILKGE